ncbi:MAG: hypothetical protein QM685_10980 [Paraburkholderia sp.]
MVSDTPRFADVSGIDRRSVRHARARPEQLVSEHSHGCVPRGGAAIRRWLAGARAAARSRGRGTGLIVLSSSTSDRYHEFHMREYV